jgi:DNA-binding SARP family transcriptional activator
VVSPDWIQCNPEIDLWLDVDAFEKSYRDTEAVPGDDLSSGQIETLREAVELYSGDLLENLYEEWCLYERERLQHLYFAMLDKLTTYHEAHRNFELAKSFAERILYHDRAREYTHRQLMRLRYLSGDRTGAIRQYESCSRALHEDLDIEASDATVRLYEQIRTDRLSADPAATSGLPATAPYEMISHLRTALNHLAEAQERVRKEISLLEESLLHVKR